MERLPEDVAEVMRVMHRHRDPRLSQYMAWMRRQNWSGVQIAEPLGWSRQAVNQRVNRWLEGNDGRLPANGPAGLPRVPFLKSSPRSSSARSFALPVEMAATLAGLWMMSSRVRRQTPADHPSRRASELFDARVADAVRAGFSVGQIAHDIGVEERLVRLRLSRHGLSVAAIRGGAA